jgi:hypothetical protein
MSNQPRSSPRRVCQKARPRPRPQDLTAASRVPSATKSARPGASRASPFSPGSRREKVPNRESKLERIEIVAVERLAIPQQRSPWTAITVPASSARGSVSPR